MPVQSRLSVILTQLHVVPTPFEQQSTTDMMLLSLTAAAQPAHVLHKSIPSMLRLEQGTGQAATAQPARQAGMLVY
jgi:hypothetical protein